MKSDDVFMFALLVIIFLPSFVFAMKLALSGKDPE